VVHLNTPLVEWLSLVPAVVFYWLLCSAILSAVFPAIIDLVWQVFPLSSFSWVGVPTITFGMGFDIPTPDWSFI